MSAQAVRPAPRRIEIESRIEIENLIDQSWESSRVKGPPPNHAEGLQRIDPREKMKETEDPPDR
jgi:hypothetical protein